MDEVIKLVNVYKEYKMGKVSVSALKGISLDIKKGEFVSIIGPSGSGKSTCINMIGCLDTPNKGIVYLDGKNIAMLDESNLAQIRGKKIGFIFQQFNLINNLTARENIALPMMFQGEGESERLKKADELLSLVDLGDRGNHYPNQLSGGQQQRVAIARALVNNPSIIFADGPTGNLDSKSGADVKNILQKLSKEGKTIIMVTHESGVSSVARTHIEIHDGKIRK